MLSNFEIQIMYVIYIYRRQQHQKLSLDTDTLYKRYNIRLCDLYHKKFIFSLNFCVNEFYPQLTLQVATFLTI